MMQTQFITAATAALAQAAGPSSGPTSGASSGPAAAGPDRSLLDYILQGREIGLIIIALSVVSVGLIIAQYVLTRTRRLAPPEHTEALGETLGRGDVASAIAYCNDPGVDSMLTRTVGAALTRAQRSPFGLLELADAVEESGREQVARLGGPEESSHGRFRRRERDLVALESVENIVGPRLVVVGNLSDLELEQRTLRFEVEDRDRAASLAAIAAGDRGEHADQGNREPSLHDCSSVPAVSHSCRSRR